MDRVQGEVVVSAPYEATASIDIVLLQPAYKPSEC